jgi:DNA-binding response OmpR family regulator
MRQILPAPSPDVVSALRVELSRRGYERVAAPARQDGIVSRIRAVPPSASDVELWRHVEDEDAARILIVTGPEEARTGALVAGDIALYPATREVEAAGTQIHLTPTEFEFLRLLIEAAGNIVPLMRLLSVTRNLSAGMPTNVISVHMYYVRRKLQAAGATALVKTIRGIGYRLKY